MTHPVYFPTYSSCWHPTTLGAEAPPLSPFRLASGLASSVAPRRPAKRGVEAQPASESRLCEGALRGPVFSSLFLNHCYCCFSQLMRYFLLSASFSTWRKTIQLCSFLPWACSFQRLYIYLHPHHPLPCTGIPSQQKRVKRKGIAVQVSQGFFGLITPMTAEKAVYSHTKQSELSFQLFPTVPVNRTLISTQAVA